MTNGYYYLISSLPELTLNDKAVEFDMLSFRKWVWEHLDTKDQELLAILYYSYDIQNMVNLMTNHGSQWQKGGNYYRSDWERYLQDPIDLPPGLRFFLQENPGKWKPEDYKSLLNKATTYFINWCRTLDNDFLRRWLRFEQNLKNLLIWLNSYKFGLDPTDEVLGDYYEAEYLRQASPTEIDLKAWDFRFREVMVHFDNSNIALREFIIDEMRWRFLDELETLHSFGIERLLGFAIRLQIINRNIESTEERGKNRLKRILNDIRSNYEVPTAF